MRLSMTLSAAPKAQSVRHTRDLVLTVMRSTVTKREAQNFAHKYSKDQPKRISLVRLSGFSDEIGRTLSHMRELGAYPVVVLDSKSDIEAYLTGQKSFDQAQNDLADRAYQISKSIASNLGKSRTLLSAFDLSVSKGLTVHSQRLILPLSRGAIPVLTPITYDEDLAEFRFADANRALKAITETLAHEPGFELDKVIFIDPAGGLPSSARNAAHVHVNITQEMGDIFSEIQKSALSSSVKTAHLRNLEWMNVLLGLLPAKCIGLITTPEAAGAVLDRNAIIYNILTDRPLISSSLPVQYGRSQLVTTVLRRGLPVHIHFDEAGFDLGKYAKAGRLNLAKLVNLINQSFRKKLDVEHYLDRIRDRTAALIVVGDYEGAAIITWERAPTGRKVAYLDKLAVKPSSQGAAGVADIILNRMLRQLFPDEIIWRSRGNNPVNRWYFERSRGFMRIPDTPWVMFWNSATPAPPLDEYNAICANIEPSLR